MLIGELSETIGSLTAKVFTPVNAHRVLVKEESMPPVINPFSYKINLFFAIHMLFNKKFSYDNICHHCQFIVFNNLNIVYNIIYII